MPSYNEGYYARVTEISHAIVDVHNKNLNRRRLENKQCELERFLNRKEEKL